MHGERDWNLVSFLIRSTFCASCSWCDWYCLQKNTHTHAVARISFFSGKSLKGVANHVNERAHVPCSHSTTAFNALLIWCATMHFAIGSTQLQKRVRLTLATFYNFTYVNNIFQVHHDFITCYIPPIQCNWIRKCFALLVLKLTSDTHTHTRKNNPIEINGIFPLPQSIHIEGFFVAAWFSVQHFSHYLFSHSMSVSIIGKCAFSISNIVDRINPECLTFKWEILFAKFGQIQQNPKMFS